MGILLPNMTIRNKPQGAGYADGHVVQLVWMKVGNADQEADGVGVFLDPKLGDRFAIGQGP